MTQRFLSISLLIVALTAVTLSMTLNEWSCGGLFTSCLDRRRATTIAIIGLFCSGLAALFLTLILDLINCCVQKLDYDPSFTTTRLCALLIGVILTLAGLVVYTAQIDRQWSYLLATTGVVFAMQVSFLGLMNSQCVSYRRGVRTTNVAR
ncbi:hypothetical protein CSKR_107471 [Clonorchis sinensis]|uniref:Uncharacterized protein n=2 Tax=Clonorchis sinensis TaxID=79923 RepID=A0A8T1MUV9_CLOSI|nr:hypothetical protein CSKR_107471 [Clonorchis sinensis]GAA55827.1 hypothetical protein CLF_109119 [Clonorchis sinensis]